MNIKQLVEKALEEDIQTGDVTTDAIVKNKNAYAKVVAKEEGIIAGMDVAKEVFNQLDNSIKFNQYVNDGDKVDVGDIVYELEGNANAILKGERTALNFMQRMSGIATYANQFAELTKNTKILDTRKTTPLLRELEKYAVKVGGCENHRFGLYDMAMIKDNHIQVAGSIENAVQQVRNSYNGKVEVETTNLEEVQQAIDAKADIIMLDNMDNQTMKEAVQLIDGRAKTEASGNMTLERIKGVAETGVDYISIGALTHSYKALDLSMKVMIE
ncbi:carboxylating nicotinate-nucleotide diphosphorylase [Nanoarchaeota archaeon]